MIHRLAGLLPALAAAFMLTGCAIGRLGAAYTERLMVDSLAAIADEADLELARSATFSSAEILEGIARAEPGNADVHLRLAQQYAGMAFAFVEPEVLASESRDARLSAAARAEMFYERSLRHAADALVSAGVRAADGEEAHWDIALEGARAKHRGAVLAYASSLGGILRMQQLQYPTRAFPRAVDALRDQLDWLIEADPALGYAAPLVMRGALRAVAPLDRGGDREAARRDFERALALTEGRALVVHVLFAELYCTEVGDRDLFETLLNEVARAPRDVLPGQRFLTVVAKQRAELLAARADEWFE